MNAKHYIGNKAASFEGKGESAHWDGVALLVDDHTAYYAGAKTGNILEAQCPYGTQEMADAVWQSVQGQSYVGYEARGAALPIAAELGDGVTVRGLYAPVTERTVRFGPGHISDIAAAADGQVSHEFGYTDPVQRQIERKSAETRSYVDKTAEQVKIGVADEVDGKLAEFNVQLGNITASVSDLAGDVSAQLALKVGRDENDQIVSMLNASADQIDIEGSRIKIQSSNFTLDYDGNITARSGKIGNFEIMPNGYLYNKALSGGGVEFGTTFSQLGVNVTNADGTTARVLANLIEVSDADTNVSRLTPTSVESGRFVGRLDGPAWKELWTNPSPTAGFDAKNLVVSQLNTCNLILVVQNSSNGATAYASSAIYYKTGYAGKLAVVTPLNTGAASYQSALRVYDFANFSSNIVAVEAGQLIGAGGSITEDNRYAIPVAILGAKA